MMSNSHKSKKCDNQPRSPLLLEQPERWFGKEPRTRIISHPGKSLFGEDLTSRDKETRNKLWPHIETARKEGKKAFFRGAKAIIDGKELRYDG